MRKTSKKELVNLLFSAFLIVGYIVSMYFLNTLLSTATDPFTKSIIDISSLVVFGLLLFYATRVGDGKQIKRLNLPVLILVDIPALYVVLASLFTFIPFSTEISTSGIPVVLAAVALGYAIPYTFLAGYEVKTVEEVAKEEQETLEENVSDEDYEYTTLDIDVNSTQDSEENEEEVENEDENVEAIDESEVLEKVEESKEEK